MTGQDRSHERVCGLRTGGHRQDLLVDALSRYTCADGRMGHRRVSIEHITSGDLIT
jgi:hypothetical protein